MRYGSPGTTRTVDRPAFDAVAHDPHAPRRAAQGPPLALTTLQGPPVLSVTLHDVAPGNQLRCERLLEDLARLTPLRVTLLVVPRYHHARPTRAFEHWLDDRVAAGDELALHGLTHVDEAPPARTLSEHARRRWLTDGEGEFAALSATHAAERLQVGRDWFAEHGWTLRGFVAPAWLVGPGAWEALTRERFDYTCTLRHLVAMRAAAPHGALPALEAWSVVASTRAAWRRRASLAWNGVLVRRQQAAAWMRFELHPSDADHTSIRLAMMRWIERALEAGREPLTLAQVVDRIDAPPRAVVPQLTASTSAAVAEPSTAPTTTSLG